MSNWLHRVGVLFGGRARVPTVAPLRGRAAVASVHREPPAPVPAPAATPAFDTVPDLQLPFFEWLVDAGPALDTARHDSEQHLLARLDAVLASDSSRTALLPRAPAVIPQLLNSLRDDSQSAGAIAERIVKDPHLVAEVLRMANSAQTRAITRVTDIPEAVNRLGTDGLRRAIARVVLKPMFDGQADSLSARCAPRLWQHSEAKAAACLNEAAARGLDPFDGYLAGLMHNVGWTAALRAIDRSEGGAPTQFSRAFVAAFEPRRESFFALLVMPWQLTDALTELAVELLDGGLAAARSPLGEALRAADTRASLAMLGAASLMDAIEVGVAH